MASVKLPSGNGFVSVETVLAALADPARWRIVTLLQSGDRSVNDLAADFELSRSAVSRHLATLRDAGIVHTIKRGTRVVSILNRPLLTRLASCVAEVGTEDGKRKPRMTFNESARRVIRRLPRLAGSDVGAAPEGIIAEALSDPTSSVVMAARAARIDRQQVEAKARELADTWRPVDGELPDAALTRVVDAAIERARHDQRPTVASTDLVVAALADADGRLERLLGDDGNRLATALEEPAENSEHDDGSATSAELSEQLHSLEQQLSSVLDSVTNIAATIDEGEITQ